MDYFSKTATVIITQPKKLESQYKSLFRLPSSQRRQECCFQVARCTSPYLQAAVAVPLGFLVPEAEHEAWTGPAIICWVFATLRLQEPSFSFCITSRMLVEHSLSHYLFIHHAEVSDILQLLS